MLQINLQFNTDVTLSMKDNLRLRHVMGGLIIHSLFSRDENLTCKLSIRPCQCHRRGEIE